MSETEKYISIEEAYELWLSAIDKAQAEPLSKAMVKKLYPLVKGKKINHSTMAWALGKMVGVMIDATNPGSPELAMMMAVAIHRTTVTLLQEHKVGGERQVGHA